MLFAVLTATAAPFQNGSFEVPAQVEFARNLAPGDTSVKGWRVEGTGPVAIDRGSLQGDRVPYEFGGSQYLSFNGGQKPAGGTIQQTFDTEPGQAYEVGFVLGRAGNGTGELSMECTLYSENGDLLRRTNAVAPTNLGWGATNQIFFVATGPQATIVFRDTSLTTDSADVLLDAVHITALPRPTINLYAGGNPQRRHWPQIPS